MYINSTHTNWDDILPYITFAYNSSIQESTGNTLFCLLYGRETRFSVDMAMGVHVISHPEGPEALARNLETAWKGVKMRFALLQERLKRHAKPQSTYRYKFSLFLFYKV